MAGRRNGVKLLSQVQGDPLQVGKLMWLGEKEFKSPFLLEFPDPLNCIQIAHFLAWLHERWEKNKIGL